MSRNKRNARPDTSDKSSAYIQVKVTPGERARWHAMARYRRLTLSGYMRFLAEKDREDLIKSGKRPPRGDEEDT